MFAEKYRPVAYIDTTYSQERSIQRQNDIGHATGCRDILDKQQTKATAEKVAFRVLLIRNAE